MRHRELVAATAITFAASMMSAQTTEIIDITGDGMGNSLESPRTLAVDLGGTAFVPGASTDNAFKVTSGGTITEIIDGAGDGGGNTLNEARAVAVIDRGFAYVAGRQSDNAFRIVVDKGPMVWTDCFECGVLESWTNFVP